MNADISGALKHIENGGKGWKVFTHNGKSLTKAEVVNILQYGVKKGYNSTGQLTDKEVDEVLKNK